MGCKQTIWIPGIGSKGISCQKKIMFIIDVKKIETYDVTNAKTYDLEASIWFTNGIGIKYYHVAFMRLVSIGN